MSGEVNDYPFRLEQIVSWITSQEALWVSMGISFAGLRQNSEHVPSGCADFDCSQTMGRLSFWVTGQFDFEVLRCSDGQLVFLRHEHIQNIEAQSLNHAFLAFLKTMSGHDETK